MPTTSLETKRIVGEMASRHGIRMDERDPALAMVALNRLMLEQSSDQIVERVRDVMRDFEAAVQKVQTRAGQLIGAEFNDRVAAIRGELQDDITGAGARAAEIVYRVEQANRRPVMLQWAALGILGAILMFVAGLWTGIHYR